MLGQVHRALLGQRPYGGRGLMRRSMRCEIHDGAADSGQASAGHSGLDKARRRATEGNPEAEGQSDVWCIKSWRLKQWMKKSKYRAGVVSASAVAHLVARNETQLAAVSQEDLASRALRVDAS